MKNFYYKTVILITTIIVFFMLSFVFVTLGLGNTYNKAYQSILNEKYELLQQTKSTKVVYLGGSSGVFGFDGTLFEKKVGIPTVNLSVHAGFGMEFAANMLKNNINEGDIVILGLEPHLLWGDDINAPTIMTAIDDNIKLYKFLPLRYYDDIIKYFPTYMFKKLDCYKGGYQAQWVYSTDAFDKEGNMCYYRTEVVEALSDIKSRSCNIEDILPQKVEYINNLNDYVQKQGGTLLYTYAPVYDGYIKDDTNLIEYGEYLENVLSCDIISNIKNCRYSKEFMFDTEYHLNTSGQFKNTVHIIDDFKTYMIKNGRASQLTELFDKNLTIDMSTDGKPEWYIIKGFHTPENSGTWTNEEESVLGFSYITDTNVELCITGFPIQQDKISKIYFNDIYIGNLSAKYTQIKLRREWFNESWQELTIITDDVQSPLQLGLSEDSRNLGYLISNISLKSE